MPCNYEAKAITIFQLCPRITKFTVHAVECSCIEIVINIANVQCTKDYFNEIRLGLQIRWHFRMTIPLFLRIASMLEAYNEYFQFVKTQQVCMDSHFFKNAWCCSNNWQMIVESINMMSIFGLSNWRESNVLNFFVKMVLSILDVDY